VQHRGRLIQVQSPSERKTSAADETIRRRKPTVVQLDDGHCGFIDRTGRLLVKTDFTPLTLIGQSHQGLATFTTAGTDKTGFIDRKGRVVIPAQFDFATDFTAN